MVVVVLLFIVNTLTELHCNTPNSWITAKKKWSGSDWEKRSVAHNGVSLHHSDGRNILVHTNI